MTELLEVLGQIASEMDGAGKMTAMAALLLVAKYSVDVLRTKLVQRGLAGIETGFKLPPGSLQWRAWSDRTRVLVTMGQAFLVGLIGSVSTGMGWGPAAAAALVAAVGAKGLHDSGVLPGRRPSKRGPATVIDRRARPRSMSRDIGLRRRTEAAIDDAPETPPVAPSPYAGDDDEPTEPEGRRAVRVPGAPLARPKWGD